MGKRRKENSVPQLPVVFFFFATGFSPGFELFVGPFRVVSVASIAVGFPLSELLPVGTRVVIHRDNPFVQNKREGKGQKRNRKMQNERSAPARELVKAVVSTRSAVSSPLPMVGLLRYPSNRSEEYGRKTVAKRKRKVSALLPAFREQW